MPKSLGRSILIVRNENKIKKPKVVAFCQRRNLFAKNIHNWTERTQKI